MGAYYVFIFLTHSDNFFLLSHSLSHTEYEYMLKLSVYSILLASDKKTSPAAIHTTTKTLLHNT